MTQTVNVVGAGLAGSKLRINGATWNKVNLIEMRPVKQTPHTILINLLSLYVQTH